jgi:hypothetical protein
MTSHELETAVRLAQQARLSETEPADLLARTVDRGYWGALAPELNVAGEGVVEHAAVGAGNVAGAVGSISRDGFFHLKDAVPPSGVSSVNAAIDAVVSAGWPPVFAFVYDEVWRASRASSVRMLLDAFLGPGVRQLPHIWTHIVDAVPRASGWPPHVDRGGPGRLTVWVAVTNATVENGCMYVVRKGAAPRAFVDCFGGAGSLTSDDLHGVLAATRALPAAPGDALGWVDDVVHWGSSVQGNPAPRRSISLEFISGAEQPRPDEMPVLPLDRLPSWEERLRAIALGLIEYSKFEPTKRRFDGLARGLVWRGGGAE